MACPRCDAPLVQKGGNLVCSRETCGYSRESIKHIPSQEELLKENEELKKYIVYFKKREASVIETIMEINSFIEAINKHKPDFADHQSLL